MLSGYIVISAIIALVMIVLSLFVYIRNPRAALNRLFLTFSVLMAAWLATNYLGGALSVPKGFALIANRLTFLFACGALLGLYLFSLSLIRGSVRKTGKVIIVASALAIIVAPTSYVVRSISPTQNTYGINFGFAANFYFLVLLLNVSATIVTLMLSRRHLTGFVRSQINTVLAGIAIFLIGVISTNALMPFLFHYYGLTNAGALFSLFLIGGMAYAITKHHLFDVRLIVARSLGYLLSLVSIGAIFISGTFTLTSVFFDNTNLNAASIRWVYTFLAVILAFLFAPLKRFFDKNTNRFFFRDTYDTQMFLDEFNKVLVGTYDLSPLLHKSSEVIEQNLKPSYCAFEIGETETRQRRLIGTNRHPTFSSEDFQHIGLVTEHTKQRIIMVDELEKKYDKFKERLQSNDIAVIARLTPSNSEEGVGYLLLGPKKSGNLYSSQDLGIIEIITNELVIAIQNALRFEEIENFNITLQQKVDDATRKLRRTNEKLKELDETKDDFISMASHQLRTPLTSVKGYISMIMEEDAGKINHMQREMLGQAFFSSQRMVYLIADLLNVSRLKTGKFVIETASVNLANMVQQELEQLEETAAARKLTIQYDKPTDFPSLMLDETKTRQVVMNFVDNAIYYTPAGGHIIVRLANKPSTIELSVEDNGIGVPKAEQHHLFTKFYRAGNARKARPDGTGLGLFMAKKVVLAEGGSIIFNSTEGKGSTFGFQFSKAKLAATSSPSATKSDKDH